MGCDAKINETIWHVLWSKFIKPSGIDIYSNERFLFFPEIAKVRASLFQINGVKKEPLVLPEPEGMVTTLTEKVYVPVKEHPDVSNNVITLIIACDVAIYLKSQSAKVKGVEIMMICLWLSANIAAKLYYT